MERDPVGTSAQQDGSTFAGLAGHPIVPGIVILRSVLGSQAYGMATPNSDYDRQGVFVTSRKELTGLRPPAETISVTDPDYTFHEVGKFIGLALKCNPTILEQLYVESPEIMTDAGWMLRLRRGWFLSKPRIVGSFGGYAMDQINRLQRRGDGSFSSDTRKRREKHARHCFRLLWQGKELLETGEMAVRLPRDKVDLLFKIGEMNDADLMTAFQEEDAKFKAAAETSNLPETANFNGIANLLDTIRDRVT
jgi:hypothetical protein